MKHCLLALLLFSGTFTSILVSPNQYGIGGYAEMSYGIRSKSVEYTVKFDGLYNTKRTWVFIIVRNKAFVRYG